MKLYKIYRIIGIEVSIEKERGMIMEQKRTYYINISSGEISQSASDSPWNYQIEATPEDIQTLRSYFDQNEKVDLPNFIRAHIPFLEYHHDKVNDIQDHQLKQIYQFIYQHASDDTKQHIESIGILNNL
jgi:hypothetical protein